MIKEPKKVTSPKKMSKTELEAAYMSEHHDNASLMNYLKEQHDRKYRRKKDAPPFVGPKGQVKNEDDILVKLRDVRIAFKRGNTERVVIEHLNLDIKKGEILGLVGESGSGKTTIGRAIIRINPVSGGVIAYNNIPISGKINRALERAIKTKIQMVFQDPSASLNERANVDYIVSEGLRAFHLYENEEDRLNKVTEMLEKVGLMPEHLKRYPHEFSGGQRQRIGIARCMIMGPELVIADEPISALDVSIRAQVLNLIKQFQQENNMTVLFIAHDLSVVRYISDRIAVINSGKIVELCDANRLFEAPLHPYTKALLSAVPIPDPRIESKKKIVVYSPDMHHYTEDDMPDFYEIEPNHFVRANKEELERYKKDLEVLNKYNEQMKEEFKSKKDTKKGGDKK